MTLEMMLLSLVALLAVATFAVVFFLGLRLRARFLHLDRQLGQLSEHVTRETTRAVRQSQQSALEVQYANSLNQLGFTSPLFLGGWSIDAFLGKFLVNELIEGTPKVILELGSGSSTLLLARAIEFLGLDEVRHIAVDHDPRYLDLTRRSLAMNKLASKVDLWLCPLGPVDQLEDSVWYTNLLERLQGAGIDLAIVDGPPGDLQGKSRAPAMRLLRPYLSSVGVVILDDANRPDEQAISEQWARENPGFIVEWERRGHGFSVFRRQGA